MTYDAVPILARFSRRKNIGFILQFDPKSEIISAFGLFNRAYPPDSPWHGVAHPMILVVDAEGIVRHRFSERRYRDRPDVDVVLDTLRKEVSRYRFIHLRGIGTGPLPFAENIPGLVSAWPPLEPFFQAS